MGEEKPDEELMGKRKSSPRLSTTFMMSLSKAFPFPEILYIRDETFFTKRNVWYDMAISTMYIRWGQQGT